MRTPPNQGYKLSRCKRNGKRLTLKELYEYHKLRVLAILPDPLILHPQDTRALSHAGEAAKLTASEMIGSNFSSEYLESLIRDADDYADSLEWARTHDHTFNTMMGSSRSISEEWAQSWGLNGS